MHRTPNHQNNKFNRDTLRGGPSSRAVGGVSLRANGIRLPDRHNVHASPRERLRASTHNAVENHLRNLSGAIERRDGRRPEMNAAFIRNAYISQRKRMKNEKVTGDMTTSQLTAELMAKAVLFGPTVSDALKHRHTRRSKDEFAEWNDILAEIARSLPSGQLQPGFKTDIASVLKEEILALSNQIHHSAEICGKDPKSKRDNITQDFLGVQGEVSVVNDLQTDTSLDVRVPDAEEFGVSGIELDREGIDVVIGRPEDGKTIFVDLKSHGSYLNRIADLQGEKFIDEDSVGRCYFTGMHERGAPHYLIDIDSYGEIPADGFHFTEQGRIQLISDVHYLLDE
ncbi:hypothetical protein KC953_03640 [Candidatus Saccharibacteria bacterium]|nr:hypothetical protein [Candidatus Saccharibacteria bacterium]